MSDTDKKPPITIDYIQSSWEQDCGIDRTKLTEESLKTPKLHAKYLNTLMACKSKLIKLDKDLNDLKLAKFRYYRGEMSKEELDRHGWSQYQGLKPLKSDLESFLSGDKDLLVIKQKIDYYLNMVYQLESIMKQISSRDWQIRNAIENQKFLAGS